MPAFKLCSRGMRGGTRKIPGNKIAGAKARSPEPARGRVTGPCSPPAGPPAPFPAAVTGSSQSPVAVRTSQAVRHGEPRQRHPG